MTGEKGKEMIFNDIVSKFFSNVIKNTKSPHLRSSSETMEFRRQWVYSFSSEGNEDLFKVLKEKDYQARILYPAKPPFKIREEIKTFLEKNERTHHQQI